MHRGKAGFIVSAAFTARRWMDNRISGMGFHALIGTNTQQDVGLDKLPWWAIGYANWSSAPC